MNLFRNRPLATCCSVFIFVFFLYSFIPSFIMMMSIPGLLVICIIFLKKRFIVSAVSLFSIFACIFGYCYFDIHVARASTFPDETHTEFRILDISFCNEKIAYVDGKNTDGYKVHYTIYQPPEIEVGDVVKGVVTYKNIVPSDDFDSERYYNSKDIWIEGEVKEPELIRCNSSLINRVVSGVREFCTNTFDKYTDDETSAVLSALSIGDKSQLDKSVRRDFTRAGLSHMLAISGMHLSVIMGCIVICAEIFSVNKRWSSAVVVLICVCYIFIAGASSSILRAGVMFILMSLASVFRRVSDSLTNLMLSVTLILIFSPSAVFDTGLILSFTATFGIVTIVGGYMRRVKDIKRGIFRKLLECIFISVLTTLAAHTFSFIPMLIFFDSFSVISLVSNLIISPFITVILFAIPLLLAFSKIPFAASVIGFALDTVTGIMIWTVAKISSIPNAAVDLDHPFVPYTLIAIAVGVVFIFVFKKRNAYMLPYICWFVAFLTAFCIYNLNITDKCDIVMYSEASSDAVIMRNAKGCVYLDLGKGSAASEDRAFKVINDEMYANEIDCWILTAYSDGSVKSVAEHLNDFYVRSIYLPIPYDEISEVVARELEYYSDKESVDVLYYDYESLFAVNGFEICIHRPLEFERSSVSVGSADIRYGERVISYVGCGYFDYCLPESEYDILYLGECGTKRKQKRSPDINCNESYIADNNDIASKNINNRMFFTDDTNRIKIRISR